MNTCCIHQSASINEHFLLKAVFAGGGISVGLLLSKHSSQYNFFFFTSIILPIADQTILS